MSNKDGLEDPTSIVRIPRPSVGGVTGVSKAASDQEAHQEENPIKVFFDRMHGRWRWVILITLIIAPIMAAM